MRRGDLVVVAMQGDRTLTKNLVLRPALRDDPGSERHGLSHTCQPRQKQLRADLGSLLFLAPTIMKSRVIGTESIRWDSKS
jgi:hypothetical protein